MANNRFTEAVVSKEKYVILRRIHEEIRPDRQVRDSKKRGIAIERGKASLNDKSGKREKRRTS